MINDLIAYSSHIARPCTKNRVWLLSILSNYITKSLESIVYCKFIFKFPIDKQLNVLETLLNHFVDLVQQRSLLLQRIKKSKDGSHLKIEAAFQKYVWRNTYLVFQLNVFWTHNGKCISLPFNINLSSMICHVNISLRKWSNSV